jgi:polyvinyl alcohol dehydrogenase (cytochrome)
VNRRTKAPAGAIATTALFGLAPLVHAETTTGPCSQPMAGGDWAKFGGPDGMGDNRQDAETTFTKDNVADLTESWRSATGSLLSAYFSEPIIAGGCAFATVGSSVEAHDLATGNLVWATHPEDVDVAGAYAPTVADGRVHLNVPNGGHPFAAAFDVTDGHLLWKSEPFDFGYPTNAIASGVVHDGMQVLFTTGPDFDPKARPGYAIYDAADGTLLHKQTVIPTKDLDGGYAGGGVWGTPSVDPATHQLYAGTANPDSSDREHAYDNAVIRVDLDRSSPSFGRVVTSYKGSPDSVTGYDNPLCQTFGGSVPNVMGQKGCGQTDVDFGNGPTLWRDDGGALHVAILQKTGILRVFDADLHLEWEVTAGTDATLSNTNGNISRMATDGSTLFVASNPGMLQAIDIATHEVKWSQPNLESHGGAAGNVLLANGVVYRTYGDNVYAWDADTGAQLWQAYLALQDPTPDTGSLGASVTLAGHRLLANLSGNITAFALPEA